MPVNLAGGGAGKASQHAEHGGFAGAGGAEQGEDFAGNDLKIGGRDHLDAVFAGLGIILLYFFRTNDRFAGRGLGQRGSRS